MHHYIMYEQVRIQNAMYWRMKEKQENMILGLFLPILTFICFHLLSFAYNFVVKRFRYSIK